MTVSPRSLAIARAAVQRSSGTRTERVGVLGALGMSTYFHRVDKVSIHPTKLSRQAAGITSRGRLPAEQDHGYAMGT